MTEVRVPLPRPRSGGAYEKLERKVGDYAVIGVGVQVTLERGGHHRPAGIGLCNAGSVSIKARDAEALPDRQAARPRQHQRGARLAEEASDPVEDDRGPVDYKRAMVRELTRRALRRALQRAAGRPVMTIEPVARTASRHGQRPAHAAEVEARLLLVHFIRETLSSDRHAHRLRHVELWRVHGPRRWRRRQVVHHAGRPGRRRDDRDDRGAGAGRPAAPASRRLLAGARPAVRLLHAGHDDDRDGAAGGQSESERGRDPPRDLGQPVPLHGLRQHRQSHPVRRGQDARRAAGARRRRSAMPEATARFGGIGHSVSARRIRASSAAWATTSTTSSCRACCSWRSCAARTRTRAS